MTEFAIIGAGAVAQSRYIPALETHPRTTVAWVVDVDEERARRVAQTVGAAHETAYETVLGHVDAAIISTPPRFHESIARDCIQEGVHVLSEKPIAMSSEQAVALTEMSQVSDIEFAICRQYREAPASRLLKAFVQSGHLGSIQRVRGRFGDETQWQFESDYRIQEHLAGGGVLADKGPHLIDLVRWILGEDLRVDQYRDDSFGGLEANAEINFSVPGTSASGAMEVSASRNITNVIEIAGDHGRILAELGGMQATMDTESLEEETVLTTADDDPPRDSRERMTRQVHRFVDSLETGSKSYVPAHTDIPIQQIIEACYSQREPLVTPWERKHFELAERSADVPFVVPEGETR